MAIGFARSPATLAYTAWDLAQASNGRFILGLGTQVRAHIVSRFGMEWPESPVGKFRDLLAAIRSFWHAWQSGERLNYRGRHYKLTLMPPFFNPGPISHPDIPIYIAGVNTGLARLAGEAANGFHVHPFHSASYLNEVLLPAISEGLAQARRGRDQIKIFVTVMEAVNPEQREFIRSQIAFYASTPSYRPVMAHHGWGDVAEELSSLARRKQWGDMPKLITDEMLATFGTLADPDELPGTLIERYDGLADRLSLYHPFVPGERDDFWRHLAEALSS